jgi:hypothetical protein
MYECRSVDMEAVVSTAREALWSLQGAGRSPFTFGVKGGFLFA